MRDANLYRTNQKRIVIIGAGFGGIELAKRLWNSEYQIVIIDKNNYFTFLPLIYQVATGGLEAGSIAYPVRRIFRNSNNIFFRLAQVQSIVPERNCILTSIGEMEYDYLVISTGSTNNFFNLESAKNDLMPLKTIVNALDLRSHLFQSLEAALVKSSSEAQEELMGIAVVGGGPTGIETAGALAEMKRYVLPKDYPELNIQRMQIYLFEATGKLLGGMSEKSSQKALEYLKKLGVNVVLNTNVQEYKDNQLIVSGKEKSIAINTVIWTAGVKGFVVEGLKPEAYLFNRIKTDAYNLVDGYTNIYAIGDVAAQCNEQYPRGYPMLAQVAIAQAKNLGNNFKALLKAKQWSPYTFKSKGVMATIGRSKAVVDLPKSNFQGSFAWYIWTFVHIFTLIGFRNKFVIFWDWVYNFFTYDRTLRLIMRPYKKGSRQE